MLPSDLTEPERELWAAFPRGAVVDLRSGDATADDVTTGAGWGPHRTVRAEVIQALLLGAVPPQPGHVASIRLHGALVTGRLRLAYAEVAAPIRLSDCHLTEVPDLYGARVRRLNLAGSMLPGLDLARTEVDGNLGLIGLHSTGQLKLTGARVGGALLLTSARLEHPDGTALLANRLAVGDDLLLTDATVLGEVRLAGAQIGGMVGLGGARLVHPGGRALTGFSLRIGANLRAGQGFTVDGELTLIDAAVTGAVDLAGSRLRNPGGAALAAMGMTVGGLLDLCDGFAAEGSVRLAGVRVAGPLCLRGATLTNAGGLALDARHVQARELDLRAGAAIDGIVDLRYARFDVIHDDPGNWPAELRLDALQYAALDPPLTAERRLGWLARDSYLPSAYQQLAATYRRGGDETAARTVLLAGQRRDHAARPWPARAWGRLQDITVGYGYRPQRAAGWLLVLLLLGTVAFGLRQPPAGTDHPPAFSPLVYSLDLLLPIVDFGQGDAFQPAGWQRWLAYLLISTGWLLATTIAAGLTHTLRRD